MCADLGEQVTANVAKYLSRFGKSVFALDFDLEAPGLAYKLALDQENTIPVCKKGLVDYLYRFAVEKQQLPESLNDYVTDIPTQGGGPIRLLSPGAVPTQDYWKKLAALNWHELFYSIDPVGIPFFLNLKAAIEDEYAPDFLLIDSRTGITEIGGVATTVLPDQVVSLLINNRENLDGAREVMRAIRGSELADRQSPIDIVPVLARLPKSERSEFENGIVQIVKGFLNEPADTLLRTLKIEDVFVLHSDRELEFKEALRVGGDKTLEESELLRDYLRLFTRLVPREIIDPFIVPLVDEAAATILDDPDSAQRKLEAIASTYPHPEAYRRLLQVYRLRNAEMDTILRTGARYWEIAREASQPILWQVLKEKFRAVERYTPPPHAPLDFVQAVWEANGASDNDIAVKLGRSFINTGQVRKAEKLLSTLVEKPSAPKDVVLAYLDALMESKQSRPALDTVEKFRPILGADADFIASWARLLLNKDLRKELKEFAKSEESFAVLKRTNPLLYARILRDSDHQHELYTFVDSLLSSTVYEGPSPLLDELGEMFSSIGRGGEFEERVRTALGNEAAEEVLRSGRTRRRRFR